MVDLSLIAAGTVGALTVNVFLAELDLSAGILTGALCV